MWCAVVVESNWWEVKLLKYKHLFTLSISIFYHTSQATHKHIKQLKCELENIWSSNSEYGGLLAATIVINK